MRAALAGRRMVLAGAGACMAGGVAAASERTQEPAADPDKRPIELLDARRTRGLQYP